MPEKELLRIVALRKGRVRASEFNLRPGEKGLSLFARRSHPSPTEVFEAVQATGKQGELRIAVVSADDLERLGLKIVRTTGGTPLIEVNAIHYEARLPLWRRMWLQIRGIHGVEYFNERLSRQICAAARLMQ